MQPPGTTALARTNRYLVTPSGRVLGSRVVPVLVIAGPLLGGVLVGTVGAVVAGVIGSPLVAVIGSVTGLLLFACGVIGPWVFLLGGASDVSRAAQMWLAGDNSGVALCQRPLGRVFRADVRMRAFYTLGLIAEANGDFVEAEDLFRRAYDAVPALAAMKWKRRGQCMMLAHAATALVAMGRLEEADARVRAASALFPPVPTSGFFDALGDDTALGAAGVAAALRDLEPGRDPRVLLTLSSALVLAARGMARDALELVERERRSLETGLLPREKALLANVEARGRGLLGGGPMRSPGLAAPCDEDAASAWAERVLASRG